MNLSPELDAPPSSSPTQPLNFSKFVWNDWFIFFKMSLMVRFWVNMRRGCQMKRRLACWRLGRVSWRGGVRLGCSLSPSPLLCLCFFTSTSILLSSSPTTPLIYSDSISSPNPPSWPSPPSQPSPLTCYHQDYPLSHHPSLPSSLLSPPPSSSLISFQSWMRSTFTPPTITKITINHQQQGKMDLF